MGTGWEHIELSLAGAPGSPPAARLRARALRRRRIAARRRAVAISFLVMTIVGLVLASGGTSSATSRRGAPRAVVVRSGDTLWGIAERYAPRDADPRAYVDALIELNDLPGAPLAGQRIRLPR